MTPKGRGQIGFTLVELLVALSLSAIVMTSTMALARFLIVSSAESAERTMARLEVQYVNLWLSEDAVQAETIQFGSDTGFPLLLGWTSGNATYSFQEIDESTGLAKLVRTYNIAGEEESVSLVAKNLDIQATLSYRKTVGHEETPADVLVVDVTARGGLHEASGHYEVNPRTSVTWIPWES